MANLKASDPVIIKKFVESQRGPGFVLNFTDSEFAQFMNDAAGVDIYSEEYANYGTSKGKRLKVFLEKEDENQVKNVLLELFEHYQNSLLIGGGEIVEVEPNVLSAYQKIVENLAGPNVNGGILTMDFGELIIDDLGLADDLVIVLTQRINEIKKGLAGNSPLSVIFLCGSALEGVLYGVAKQNEEAFRKVFGAPKNEKTGEVEPISNWSLVNLIEGATRIGILDLDIKKFSHTVREFRNYIHPNQQLFYNFSPDQDTAEISWKVLQAAVNDIRKKQFHAN